MNDTKGSRKGTVHALDAKDTKNIMGSVTYRLAL